MNPWNITEVANSIGQALNMPPEEREKRHKHNFAHVTTHTAQEWAETFVRYMLECHNCEEYKITVCATSLKFIC